MSLVNSSRSGGRGYFLGLPLEGLEAPSKLGPVLLSPLGTEGGFLAVLGLLGASFWALVDRASAMGVSPLLWLLLWGSGGSASEASFLSKLSRFFDFSKSEPFLLSCVSNSKLFEMLDGFCRDVFCSNVFCVVGFSAHPPGRKFSPPPWSDFPPT